MSRKINLLASLGTALFLLSLILATLSPAVSVKATPITDLQQIGEPKLRETAVHAATAPNISDIIGATYDEERGEIIIIGSNDPDLPPMSYEYIRENLVLALRAYYNTTAPDVPGVSIEGTEDPLEVLYFGNITDTHFGQVSFESDRLLKIYNLGKDNLTGEPVTSSVPGYMSYPDRISQYQETSTEPVTTRYFFTPTIRAEPTTSPHGIVFSTTEKFIDWAYIGNNTSPASTLAAQGFVNNFNDYYWDYAAERHDLYGDTTLYEMAQLAKITAVAKWAQNEGLELTLPGINDPWLNEIPITFEANPRQTPGIVVTWTQSTPQGTYISSLRGGVYALGELVFLPLSTRAQELADRAYVGRTPTPPDMTYIFDDDISWPSSDPVNTLSIDHVYSGSFQGIGYILSIADNAVANGDFEDGQSDWIENSAFSMIRTGSPLHGNYSAIFPVYHNANVSMHQTLYIPADATHARLTYWYAVATNEAGGASDFFESYIMDQNMNKITVQNLNNTHANPYWHQFTFDASAFIGQDLELWFAATTDSADITNFYFDDISLDYLDQIAPTVTNVSAPNEAGVGQTVEVEITFHERMQTAIIPHASFTRQGTTTAQDLTPKSGSGYTNGFRNSDPTHWVGTFTFTSGMVNGNYLLSIDSSQDLARNVMQPATNLHTVTFNNDSPYVTNNLPNTGTGNVATDAKIIINFSEPINPSTLDYTITPDPGGWTLNWNGDNTAVTLSHNPFQYGSSYTFSILEAKDVDGNSLLNTPVNWSFITTHRLYLPMVVKSP